MALCRKLNLRAINKSKQLNSMLRGRGDSSGTNWEEG